MIGHLIVSDGPAFRDRIAAIVSGESELAPFDPDLRLTGRDFQTADLSDLLAELRAERVKSGTLLRSLDPVDLRRTAEFATYGAFSAGDFVHEWAFHDQDHLQQILAATKSVYLPFMTTSMQRALVA